MLATSLLSMLTGWRTCVDMEDYGCATKPWLRTFLGLERHDWPVPSAIGKVVAPHSLNTAGVGRGRC